MKKIIGIVLSFATFAGGCVGLAGCKSEKEGTLQRAIERLNTTNFTMTVASGSLHDRKLAAEYGEWRYEEEIIRCNDAEKVYMKTTTSEVYSETASGVGSFNLTSETYYYFSINGRYYSLNAKNENAKEMTRGEFLEEVSGVLTYPYLQATAIGTFINLQEEAVYEGKSACFVFGGVQAKVINEENYVKTYLEYGEYGYSEIVTSNFGTTSISLPAYEIA